MIKIVPGEVSVPDFHQYLLGTVSPRPICFASTISDDGIANLAPYSFFNAFSSNPPTVVFSSNRRVAGNTTKDTLHNVQANGEVVINAVSYDIMQQMALSSVNFPADVSEFEKVGLTPIASEHIKPPRVKESPVQMECKVRQIISLAETPGAGNLIICDVLCMHIDERILDDEQKIDPNKIDLMGRMGRAFYCRASGDAVHKLHRPVTVIGIGVDQLPEAIRLSTVLSGSDLAQLAAVPALPSTDEVIALLKSIKSAIPASVEGYHHLAKILIAEGKVDQALAILLKD